MNIKKIIPKSKTKYQVILDNDISFALYKGEINKFKLEEGEDIDKDVYDYLINDLLKKRAISRCNHLISQNEKTEGQIRDSLSNSGYPYVVIDSVVDYLKEKNYINDRRFCENYISYYKDKKGINYIKLNLTKKKVSKDIISEFLEEIENEDQSFSLRNVISKKWKSPNPPTYEEEQKLKAFLARKGYSISLINKEVKQYFSEY